MNPFQHGEVYVTDDGAETDLDLGHYERFTKPSWPRRTTTLPDGSTIRSSPRSGAENTWAERSRSSPISPTKSRTHLQLDGSDDVAIIEIGGTVGDIEGLPFIEAMRQLPATSDGKTACTSTSPTCPISRPPTS